MNKKIIVAPLDWGLGHTTRCIPVIKELLLQNAEVFAIAGSESSMSLLRVEFPELNIQFLKGYSITYSKNSNMTLSILLQTSKLIKKIKEEHEAIQRIIHKEKINGIISDNRYGLWSKKIKSIFITHQLNIQTPQPFKFLMPVIKNLNCYHISKFDECWVPDFNGSESLSGELSEIKNSNLPIEYIGPLSRFEKPKNIHPDKKYDLMGIVSGPEPQRSIFEKILFNEFKKINKKCLLICGKPMEFESSKSSTVELVSHLSSQMMNDAILSSEMIICRSGYSSIMDLAVLGKKALFVPTPGQTEQEYLAKYHCNLMNFYYQNQSNFNLTDALEKSKLYNGIANLNGNKNKLREKIYTFLNTL